MVAFSPNFAKDKTGACTYIDARNSYATVIYVTRDGGRRWSRAAASGLSLAGDSASEVRPLFSPAFGTDRTLYLVTEDGLYASTDLGSTFRPVDPLLRVGNPGNPAIFAAPPEPPFNVLTSNRRVLLAGAYGTRSAVYDAALGVHRPVVAGGDGTRLFAVPPAPDQNAPPIALVFENRPTRGNTGLGGYTAYACSGELVCSERRFALPDDGFLAGAHVARWQTYAVYVAALKFLKSDSWSLWRSLDAGRTFAPWKSLDALLADVRRATGAAPRISLVADPRVRGRWWARIAAGMPALGWKSHHPPAEQLFVSNGAGDGWQRIGFQRAAHQPGPRGRLPWNGESLAYGGDRIQLAAAADGRLFAVASSQPQDVGTSVVGLWCSTDGGRTWRTLCNR